MNNFAGSVVIATPHSRYDSIETVVRGQLPQYQIIRIRNKEDLTFEKLHEIGPTYVFFPHWSWLIPRSIFSNFECVIFHMTDLPYGRGGSPLQNLIIRGHTETKLSALKCEEGLDTGPIYLKRDLSLSGSAEDIFARAATIMAAMIVEIAVVKPTPVPQAGAVVPFERRKPQDSNLVEAKTLEKFYDYIRMLDAEGYPNAFLEMGPFRLEFSAAKMLDGRLEAHVVVREHSNE